MAFTKSSTVILAATTLVLLLLAVETQGRSIRRVKKSSSSSSGGDLCRKADYPAICRAVTKGQKGAFAATRATVKILEAQTVAARKVASAAAKKGGKGFQREKSQVIGVCLENYDDAVASIRDALAQMGRRDKGGFNSNLSAVISDLVTCDDAFDEMGIPSPLSKTNSSLRKIASTGLFLASLWH